MPAESFDVRASSEEASDFSEAAILSLDPGNKGEMTIRLAAAAIEDAGTGRKRCSASRRRF